MASNLVIAIPLRAYTLVMTMLLKHWIFLHKI